MYDVKPDRVGWTVYDAETGRPAALDGLALVELEHELAPPEPQRLWKKPEAPQQLAAPAICCSPGCWKASGPSVILWKRAAMTILDPGAGLCVTIETKPKRSPHR